MKKIFSMLLVVLILISVVGCGSTETNKDTLKTFPKSNNKITEKEKYIDLTDEEYDLLTKLVSAEASVCSEECQRAVCSVVLNRLKAGHWGDTLHDVIYYKNAFSPVGSGKLKIEKPTASVYEAVNYVVKNGPTVPEYVRYFRTDYDFNWVDYENYTVIDNVYFGYFTDWKNGQW